MNITVLIHFLNNIILLPKPPAMIRFLLLIDRISGFKYAGNSCEVDNVSGIVRPLFECEPLKLEVLAAGSPLPSTLRRKLNNITLGFNNSMPLVCCVLTTTSNETDQSNLTNSIGSPGVIDVTPKSNSSNRESTDTDRDPVGVDIAPRILTEVNSTENEYDGPPDIEGHPNLRLLPTDCGESLVNRIFYGHEAQLNELPWTVYLYGNTDGGGSRYYCSGSLVTARYVLTAAHCVLDRPRRRGKVIGAILGEHNTRQNPDCVQYVRKEYCAPPIVDVTFETVISHPDYERSNYVNDIALIRLSRGVNFQENIKPVCLPNTRALQTQERTGKMLLAAGWGVTEMDVAATILRKVYLNVTSNEYCQEQYSPLNKNITEQQLCTLGPGSRDTCYGDSGGPLVTLRQGAGAGRVFRYVQFGIVSYGPIRCGRGLPGVNTRVAYYMKWILDNISE